MLQTHFRHDHSQASDYFISQFNLVWGNYPVANMVLYNRLDVVYLLTGLQFHLINNQHLPANFFLSLLFCTGDFAVHILSSI